ncbi:hypothetical protein ACS0TY_026322 [Phlomoides rotata]
MDGAYSGACGGGGGVFSFGWLAFVTGLNLKVDGGLISMPLWEDGEDNGSEERFLQGLRQDPNHDFPNPFQNLDS